MEDHSLYNLPLVTIGIPTYNGGKRIHKALDSILEQDYPALEIMVSNNASTDNTEEVCKQYQARDSRIQYVCQPANLGVVGNYMYLLNNARGKYFLWLCDDDEFETGVISRYVHFMESHPEHVLVSGEIAYWENGKLFYTEQNLSFESESPEKRVLDYYRSVVHGAIIYGMMRREIACKIPLRPVFGTDWHFTAELAFLGKISQQDFVSYNKQAGGLSVSPFNYARTFGESRFWAIFMFLKIAVDAFRMITLSNTIYTSLSRWKRFKLGVQATWGVLRHHGISPYLRWHLWKHKLSGIFLRPEAG
jgi:glycosyltransferase involved in cell wall biosynthesis